MAKVQGPLMSMSASGTVGGTITFDKRGFVRNHVIPANPQTSGQGNVRQILLGVQKGLTKIGNNTTDAVKALAPTSYRWNSFLLSQILGSGLANFSSLKIEYAQLTQGARDNFYDSALAVGIVPQSLPYATDGVVSPGLVAYIITKTLFYLGVNVAAGEPGDDNENPPIVAFTT